MPPGSRDDESVLRGLIGSGGTRLPGDEAMRAREVSRPTPEDDAAAERDLVIRHARPVEEQPATTRTKGHAPKQGEGRDQGSGGRTRSRS